MLGADKQGKLGYNIFIDNINVTCYCGLQNVIVECYRRWLNERKIKMTMLNGK
jgi:hypothetical protein